MNNSAFGHIPVTGKLMTEVVKFGCVLLPIKVVPLFAGHLESTAQSALRDLSDGIVRVEDLEEILGEAWKPGVRVSILGCSIAFDQLTQFITPTLLHFLKHSQPKSAMFIEIAVSKSTNCKIYFGELLAGLQFFYPLQKGLAVRRRRAITIS